MLWFRSEAHKQRHSVREAAERLPDTMESSAASMALSNGWLPFLDADMEDS